MGFPRLSVATSTYDPLSSLDFVYPAPPEPGRVIEISPGVLWLRMPLPFALDHVNLWLLRDGDTWAAVDTGFATDQTRATWERHFSTTLAGKSIGRVIATHAHPDHLGLASWLAERFGCVTWMTQGEYLWAHTVWNGLGGYSTEALGLLFANNGLDPTQVADQIARGNRYRLSVPALPKRYRRIRDNEHIRIGEHVWRVIFGGGHSAEHAALYSESLAVLIAGDMLLPKISTNVSVTPADPDADAVRLFLQSLQRFAELPPDTLVLPSHGLPFRGIEARVASLNYHHAARLGEIESAAGKPITAADIVPVLFRRALDPHQLFFAMGEAIAHMNYLYYDARLSRQFGQDGVIRYIRSI